MENCIQTLVRMEVRVWVTIFSYWLRLLFCAAGHASFPSGFSLPTLLNVGFDQAKVAIKQHIIGMEHQRDFSSIKEMYISEELRYIASSVPCLNQLDIPKCRQGFTLARCSELPLAVLEGCIKRCHSQGGYAPMTNCNYRPCPVKL